VVQRVIWKVNIQVGEILPALINHKATHPRQQIRSVNITLGYFDVLVGICLQEFRKSMKRLWKDDGWDSNRLQIRQNGASQRTTTISGRYTGNQGCSNMYWTRLTLHIYNIMWGVGGPWTYSRSKQTSCDRENGSQVLRSEAKQHVRTAMVISI
jgi:hypothetical protein